MGDVRKLLIIGGSSGAGKTTVARQLAEAVGASWLQLDTIWLALKAATTPESHPEMHLFPRDADIASISVEDLLQRHIAAAREVCRAMAVAFEHEMQDEQAARRVWIVEGAWLLPEFVSRLEIPEAQVRAVYIHEDDAGKVLEAMRPRSKRGPTLTADKLRIRDLAVAYGDWLRDEANRCGLSVVSARPREGLLGRVVAALSR